MNREDRDDLQASYPGLPVQDGVPWVDCGKVVTSAGISAGIDMSLHLFERIAGHRFAATVARTMVIYLRRIRVALARELLTQSGLDIERVAEQAGFHSSRQLRRV